MSERIRQSIAVSGINTAEPCHTVADGAMEDVLNMRYKNNAFINVCEPKIIAPISNTNGYKILYTMDCIHGEYIAITGHVIHSIHRVKIENGSIISVELISVILVGYTDLKLSHFGSVLYVNHLLNGALKEQCFIFKDDKFTAFNMDNVEPPELTIDSETRMTGGAFDKYSTVFEYDRLIDGEIIRTPLFNEHLSELTREGFFVGHILLTAAYCMSDGSIVKCGPIYSLSSYDTSFEDMATSNGDRLRAKRTGTTSVWKITYASIIQGCKPTITISVNENVKKSKLFKSVVILSSVINPLFNYDKAYDEFGKYGATGEMSSPDGAFCGVNCILNESAIDLRQPLYQIAEIKLNELEPTTLTYDKYLKDIEFNPIYKASFSNHNTISHNRYDYNGRLHYYNATLVLNAGFAFSVMSAAVDPIPPRPRRPPIGTPAYEYGDDVKVAIVVCILVNDMRYSTIKQFTAKTVRCTGEPLKTYALLRNLISYPDARAESCKIMIQRINQSGQAIISEHHFSLKPSLENNVAYAYIDKSLSKDNVYINAFIDITDAGEATAEQLPEEERPLIIQTDKLYVSALNNPFFTAATNVYTIGESSSIIDGICAAAEQITETKFGLYPLYVFTNRAIYALEVGSGEIVYQRVIGVSNDMKLPNTTMVGAGNLVFFIAARGVMAIEGRKIVCISEALNRYVGLTSSDDLFQDYCTKGRLMYNPIENELILYNTDYAYAYIYSLAWRHWSRRSWGCREMGYQSEIYYNDKGVASAWIEDTLKPAADCRLESRAIKCGSLEYKRLETLVARISCGGLSNYEIKLLGSNDLKSWTPLSEANSQPLIRRTSASYKFFKVVIECVVGDYFAITNLDTEHYLRFVRRLR